MSLLVLERRPRWAPELRRALADEPGPIRACRGVDDLSDAASRAAGPCVVVLDLTDAPGPCLQWLGARKSGDRRHAVVIYAGGATAELEWFARELGAATVLPDTTTTTEMTAVCRRLLRAARE